MCQDEIDKKKFNFNVFLQGRKYVNSAYENTQIIGSNTDGAFQIILPNNVPQGRYNISVRNFNIFAANEGVATYAFKLFIDNLAMINGYNNANQSNNSCFGVF